MGSMTPRNRGLRSLDSFFQNTALPSYLSLHLAVFFAALAFSANAVAGNPPCNAPISRSDIRQIRRVIADVTTKRILVIMGLDEDHYVPGAVTGYAYVTDLKTGKTIN